MPKESKKFINPLLRPSVQEAEPKQEKSAPANRAQPAKTQVAERAERADVQEEQSKAAPQAVSERLSPASKPVDEARSASDDPQAERDSNKAPSATRQLDAAQARASKAAATTRNVGAKQDASQIAGGPENSTTLEQNARSTRTYEPGSETLRPQSGVTILRPETQDYVAHVTDPVSPTRSKDSQEPDRDDHADKNTNEDLDDSDLYPPDENLILTAKAKRKRGEQAFEKTHVRFTVWVDRNLRQSFENLAFQRDISKTTLLNEAIADLVRKYEAP